MGTVTATYGSKPKSFDIPLVPSLKDLYGSDSEFFSQRPSPRLIEEAALPLVVIQGVILASILDSARRGLSKVLERDDMLQRFLRLTALLEGRFNVFSVYTAA